jgi:DNA-binding NarL/FixJ family response regulator
MTKNYMIMDFEKTQSSEASRAGAPTQVSEGYPVVAMVQFSNKARLESKDSLGPGPRASTATKWNRSGTDEWSDGPQAARMAIVLIEPRTLIRDCLSKCLAISGGGESVEAFAFAADWVKVQTHRPVAPLVLLSTADRATAEIEREIAVLSNAEPLASIVLLSDDADSDHVLGALDKGARGYISTSMSFDVAMKAIQLVRAGGTFIPVECLRASRSPVSLAATRSNPEPQGPFTTRQLAVIEALRQGKANKIIAFELNMRESTVKVHVRNIMKKLQAKNRTEVAFRVNAMSPLDKGCVGCNSPIFTKSLP